VAEKRTPGERTPERIKAELAGERAAVTRAVAELRDELRQAATVVGSGTFALSAVAFVTKRLLGRRRG